MFKFTRSSKGRKYLFILGGIIVAGILLFIFGQFLWEAGNSRAVSDTVQGFGGVLKNVSLFSRSAAKDIEETYKTFLSPELLALWKEDPSRAIGRFTSSPWPDRIEITGIRKSDSGSYEVTGNIIEITSIEEVQGGIAAKRPITLSLVKSDGKWLITEASTEESAVGKSIASQLGDCLPKSDAGSMKKCDELLRTIRNFNDCVSAGFSVIKSDPPQCATSDGRSFVDETNSAWGTAVQAILNCEIEKAFQTRDRIVTLDLKNGQKLIVTEPVIDDVLTVIDEAKDRCGSLPVGTN